MLELIDIAKTFANQPVLRSVRLQINRGEFFALLGPSGCGKTTLLRTIAGLDQPDSGEILVDGKKIHNLPAHLRPCHTVFQSYALFPHMNVYDNIAFPLRVGKHSKSDVHARVMETLDLVELRSHEHRDVTTLSGGQQQRVALARALAGRPELLLLDEPLSALDFKLRQNMRQELRKLQQKLGLTFVFVTHDQDEALSLADRVAVMNKGNIEQVDKPEVIYQKPSSQFVADFVGRVNQLSLEGERELIRPEHMKLFSLEHQPDYDDVCRTGRIEQIHYRGASIDYRVVLSGEGLAITVAAPAETARAWRVEESVKVVWRRDTVLRFAR